MDTRQALFKANPTKPFSIEMLWDETSSSRFEMPANSLRSGHRYGTFDKNK
jgi:hypothetical protein